MSPASSPYIPILTSLVFSAFFSGIEAAFLGVDKLGMELARSSETLVGRLLTDFARNPSRFLTTLLIGNTIALVVYSACVAEVIGNWICRHVPYLVHSPGLCLGIETLLSTFVVLVVAEFIPKRIFLRSPYRLLKCFAIPMRVITYVLWPLVLIANCLAHVFIRRVLKHTCQETRPVFGLTDLHSFIKNALQLQAETPVKVSARIVSQLIEFKKIRVRDCMTPRAEIVAIRKVDGLPALKEAAMKSQHSKILVYQDNIDNIVGYCHVKAFFHTSQPIDALLTPMMVAHEANLASEVMVRLITSCKSLALVVDEFGGVAGIVSVEDFVEEIVGDIEDEHDVNKLLAEELSPGIYLLSARHEIDYLNHTYGWHIPQGDYDTLGGFITSAIGRIPQLHEWVDIAPFTFKITAVQGARIDTVELFLDKPG
ncbi:MAG: hemolysin family protein [Bacteroidota bacterium]